MNGWLALMAGIACAAQSGCAARDPTGELRALVEAAEAAAEARNTGFFRGLVSENYVDAGGRRRDDVIGHVRAYFLVNNSIEVVNRIDEIALAGDDAAVVSLQTAVLGRTSGQGLGVDADLYEIELELVKEGGDWRIIGADWRRLLQ